MLSGEVQHNLALDSPAAHRLCSHQPATRQASMTAATMPTTSSSQSSKATARHTAAACQLNTPETQPVRRGRLLLSSENVWPMYEAIFAWDEIDALLADER